MSSPAPAPAPLVQLLRQVSVEAKEGHITAQQKSQIQGKLLEPYSKPLPAASASVSAAPPASAAASVAAAEDPEAPQLLPFAPLLRQLSAAQKSGLIDAPTKQHIKVRERDQFAADTILRFAHVLACVVRRSFC
jgi:hypothetical protein